MRLKTSTRNPLAIAALTAALAFAAAPAAAADDTVALKNALYGAGYEVGNVNSTMDEATRSALRSFQQDQGLEATGELNEATKAALGMVPMDEAASQPAEAPANANTSADTGAAESTAETEAAPEEDDAVEEDDDGGWSLF